MRYEYIYIVPDEYLGIWSESLEEKRVKAKEYLDKKWVFHPEHKPIEKQHYLDFV